MFMIGSRSCFLFTGLFGLTGQFGAALLAQTPAFFAAPTVVLPADSAPFQRLFDADGDGDMDVVGTRGSSGGFLELTLWRNDHGTLTRVYSAQAPAQFTGGAPVARVATGDIDGDGDQDVVAAIGQTVFTWRNLGFPTGTLTSRTVAGTVRDAAVADFDGDGVADIATLFTGSSGLGGTTLEVLSQNALRSTTAILPAQDSSRIVVLGLDGDPAMEIGVARFSRMEMFDVTPTAVVPQPAALDDPSITTNNAVHWVAGDIDGDGDTDVVAFELAPTIVQPNRVHVFRRTGIATFALEAAYVGGPSEYLADVDGDGDLDGVCCGGGTGGGGIGGWPIVDFASTFEIALNDGSGHFAPAFDFPGHGSRSLAGVADLDGDGDVELVAGACVFVGHGGFVRQPMPTDGLAPYRHFGELEVDMDRDGDPDVAGLPLGHARNRGDGTFTVLPPVTGLPAGTAFGGCGFVADFDGDGAPEEMWSLYTTTTPPAFVAMSMWHNNGSGVLTYAGNPAPGRRIGALLLDQQDTADIDGDGDIDAVSNCDPRFEPRSFEVFWNDGAGHFTGGPQFPGERFEGIADFDGDGIGDLVTSVGGQGVGALSLRRGTGNGAFGAGLVFPFTSVVTPKCVTLADANGDGRMDILVVDSSGVLVTWRNTTVAPGVPSLTSDANGVVGSFPVRMNNTNEFVSRIEAMDVNGDGRKDLVCGTSRASPVLAIFVRKATAGLGLSAADYEPAVEHVGPMGFARDIDGDGDLDLMGARMLRNLARHAPLAGTRTQYGTGAAGEAGVTPLLGISGSLDSGGVAVLRMSGMTGPTTALLVISLGAADLPNFPVPGITMLVDPTQMVVFGALSITDNGLGHAGAYAEFPIFIPPGLGGLDTYDQFLVLDPAGPGGAAVSNGLHVHIGF